MSKIKSTLILTLSFTPLVAGLATSIYFCVSKKAKAREIYNDFQNSAIFQELKTEETKNLSELENTYNEAKEMHEAGEMSAKDFLATEKQFNDKKDYIESRQFVYTSMEQAGVYYEYNKTKEDSFKIGAGGIPASVIVGAVCFFVGFAFVDEIPDMYTM